MSENFQDKDGLAWEEVKTEHIIQDEWIDFRRSAYRFPDGTMFEPYYSYSRRDYVVIVASDAGGNYLCVRQFRQGIKEVTTEFPAGGLERSDGKEYRDRDGASASEDALAAAKGSCWRRPAMSPASGHTCSRSPPTPPSPTTTPLSTGRGTAGRSRGKTLTTQNF